MTAKQPILANGLPVPLGPAIGRVSGPFGRFMVVAVVNRALARQIEDGLADFLGRRSLAVCITDLELEWRFTLDAAGKRIVHCHSEPDATIRGDSLALLLLAARRVDPDTLFFHRRLMVEGDTELGLQAKNLLDMLDEEDLPLPLAHLLDRAGRLAERYSGT